MNIKGGDFMFYVIYKENDNLKTDFMNNQDFIQKFLFSAGAALIKFIDLSISEKDYLSRQNHVRDIAIEYQNLFWNGFDMSYGDLFEFSAYFEKQAKKYGLVHEFKENGIL